MFIYYIYISTLSCSTYIYMASTRNNNTPGNYCLQQRQYSLARDYKSYKNSCTGRAYTTKLPCMGITPSHMPRDTLSSNPIEIEFVDVTIPNVENDTVNIGESALLVGESETLKWYQNKNDLTPKLWALLF